MISPERLIKLLKLKPLPLEGGFYRETYRSREMIRDRSLSTAIYFLLTPETVSALHKLPSDEIFHFYFGDPVVMLLLPPRGKPKIMTLGPHPDRGHQCQVIVPKHTWQGCHLKKGGRMALLGTTVTPGFDFADYVTGDRRKLIKAHPAQRRRIEKLTP